MRYHALGELPAKRHTQFRENGTLLVEEVMGITGGKGARVVFDPVGGPTVKKLVEAREFVQQSRTSGAEVFCTCPSHPDACRVLVVKTPSHVGLQQTKSRQCIVDVATIPVQKEFDLRFVQTFWNNVQDDEDRWLGFVGYPHASNVQALSYFLESIFPGVARAIPEARFHVVGTGTEKLKINLPHISSRMF